MDDGDIEGGGGGLEDEFPMKQSGRKYRPVVAHDPAVLEMSSIPPGSSSSNHQPSLKKITVGGSTQAKTNTNTDGVNDNGENGSEREHKLELFSLHFEFDLASVTHLSGSQQPLAVVPLPWPSCLRHFLQSFPLCSLSPSPLLLLFLPPSLCSFSS